MLGIPLGHPESSYIYVIKYQGALNTWHANGYGKISWIIFSSVKGIAKSLMPISGIFHRQRAWPRGTRYMFNAANRLLLLFCSSLVLHRSLAMATSYSEEWYMFERKQKTNHFSLVFLNYEMHLQCNPAGVLSAFSWRFLYNCPDSSDWQGIIIESF